MSMSSSSPAPSPSSKKAAEDTESLLREKDEEIAALKKEIASLKNHLQHDTKNALSPQQEKSPIDTSVENIANQALKNMQSSNTKVEARWKARFQQLVAYKLEHGDCNVSKSYKDKSLHSWVRTQRENKKAFDLKKPNTSMTQERVDALNGIGFQWVVGHVPKEAQWDQQFQALLQYKQQHGHTRVSQSENKQLYKWVLNQRARRRLLESKGEGKAKGMTYARVEKLTAIDFCWEATNRSSSRPLVATTPMVGFGTTPAGWASRPPPDQQQHDTTTAAPTGTIEATAAIAGTIEAAAAAAAASPNASKFGGGGEVFKTYQA